MTSSDPVLCRSFGPFILLSGSSLAQHLCATVKSNLPSGTERVRNASYSVCRAIQTRRQQP